MSGTPTNADYGPAAFEGKLCSPADVVRRVAALAHPRVFTNGVFDVLHRGHVTYLAQARALGASLIVALNADDSVRRLGKGTERPVNRLADRSAVIAALEAATLVTWFDEDTPRELIVKLKPDVLVKGGDWRPQDIVGAAEVLSWGGSVHAIPFVHTHSTTALLDRIRKS